MLQRTLEKQGPQSPRGLPRAVVIGVAAAAIVGAVYWLLPDPGPKLRPAAMSDAELLATARSLAAPPPQPSKDATVRAMAALGRKLFHDKRLSRDGTVACASCHDPATQFADQRVVSRGLAEGTRNTPSIVNAGLNTWFFWDGRADSLASQALKPLEDPREQGVSRTFVARLVMQHYATDYEHLFGKLPPALQGVTLPEQALPPPAPAKLPIEVATGALESLGSFPLLSDILTVAQSSRLAPALELGRRALLPHATDAAWHDAWSKLPESVQTAVNEVFANTGRALAQFERGIVALDAPFDRFVRRASAPERAGQAPRTTFDNEFGELEWAGLQLFAGEGRCVLCHNGPSFSDQQFHNIGLAQGPAPASEQGKAVPTLDAGRAAGVILALQDPFSCVKPPLSADPLVASAESCRELPFLDIMNDELIGAFKTPTLRNIALTAPYMHDGSLATLADVIDHYDELEARPAMGHREESLQPLHLTPEEEAALTAFLKSLTSPIRDLQAEETLSARP